MATRTNTLGLYRWLSSDQIQTTIEELSANADLMESQITARSMSVKDIGFGAKGDYNLSTKSGTSDSAAFQKALNIARDRGQVNIFIPPGNYRMTAELRLYKNTKIVCAPGARIVRDHPGYLFVNGHRTESNSPGYTGEGNLVFIGGIYDGNGAKQTGKASIFHLAHASNIVFDQVEIRDVSKSHHVELNACKDVWFDKCKILGYFGEAGGYNEAIQLDLPKPNLYTIPPADNTRCMNVYVTNCYFGNSDSTGSISIARAIGSHSATIGRPHENIQILNNTFEDLTSFGVRAYNWRNVMVHGNRFTECGAGVNFRSVIGTDTNDTLDASGKQTGSSEVAEVCSIQQNTFFRGGSTGRFIECYGESSGKVKGMAVIGNKIYSSFQSNDGIALVYCTDSQVIGNWIFGARANGILVRDGCEHITVSDNFVDDASLAGIYSDGSNNYYIAINGNVIKRAGTSGILINGGECFTITGNNIAGVNGVLGDGNANNHIRVISSAKRVSVAGNVTRNYSTTHKTSHALYVTSACQEVSVSGNVFAGFTAYNGAKNSTVDSAGNIGTME